MSPIVTGDESNSVPIPVSQCLTGHFGTVVKCAKLMKMEPLHA